MQKWNNKIAWPRDNFVLRVIEEQFGPSNSSDNPMVTLTFEVDSPDICNIAGEDYIMAGQKIKTYIVTSVIGDEEKTKNAQDRAKEIWAKFGLNNENINFENPILEFKSKLIWALLYDDESEQRKSPTKEQLAKGIKQGEVICNPITKKPLVSHYPKIGEIFGLAEANPNKPF